MRKLVGLVLLCGILWGLFAPGGLLADRKLLHDSVVRLHVVADSDESEDQELKLQVRDAVTAALEEAMGSFSSPEEARAYLAGKLSDLRVIAEETLRANGCTDEVEVTLAEEAFPTRHYDSFSLPAGVYHALRVTIGSGEGKNWWCVVFPTLCYSVAEAEMEDVAAGAGFSDTLTQTLEGKDGYEIRFFLLDVLGELENFLRFG